MAALIVLSSGEWLSCAVCSVSDICVRLYSLYQASGGPRKLNPISVFIQPVSLDVYTALRFAPSVSLCAWVACQMQPAVLKRAQLHYCTWCVCLLVCVCVCVCAAMWQGRMRQAALTPLVSHESHIRSGLPSPAAAAPGRYSNHTLDLCRRLMFHGFIKGDESGSQWPDWERKRTGGWGGEWSEW